MAETTDTAIADQAPAAAASPVRRRPPARRPNNRTGLKRFLLALPVPFLFLVFWQVGQQNAWEVPVVGIRMEYLPAPADVITALWNYAFGSADPDAFSGELWINLGASSLRVLTGFAIAAAIAIPLGILMGRYYTMDSLFDPFINLFRPIPATAWVPLVGLLIGWGDQATVFLIALSAFFPIVLGAISGSKEVPPRLIEAGQMLGARKWEVLAQVVVPASAAAVMNGLRVGLGIAWVVLVLGESVGVSVGLGADIILARDVVRTDQVVVGMIVIGAAGFLSDRLLVGAFRLGTRGRPLIK
ncbi:NitT/TauT family transport system permease protein [Microbacterium terrae]|uniref:ABC transporter permease n=2 Tax=Microbacterium terrae TaxID=69369 RepID=UPI001B3A96F2|nr:ABC transporter permease [Microbacterium terrae]MBP1078787.1 NitT/TauT family transport system permease protein [Microbacterium terrae]GLJ98188.1 binding-protein-dependent transport system inner membrane protein [Microbacterium terrae]